MIANYTVLNPTGNITALVTSEVEIEKQPFVASLIMTKEPSVEQVGFVDLKKRAMRMAGGEFCGNASMCAAVMCLENKLLKSESTEMFLCVSGAPEKVAVNIKKEDENSFLCVVSMPKAKSVSNFKFTCKGEKFVLPVVEFDGIYHIINEFYEKKDLFSKEIKEWCTCLGCDSLGIMNVETEKNKITPLVFVKSPETLVWENSCASGTAAAGVYFAQKNKSVFETQFCEPGGVLGVKADVLGNVFIKGTVSTLKNSETIEY